MNPILLGCLPDPDENALVFSTMCGADDQFPASWFRPQIHYSSLLGKILVTGYITDETARLFVRNSDLSFSSKVYMYRMAGIASDNNNVYVGKYYTATNADSKISKYDSSLTTVLASSDQILTLRNLDANCPGYLFATSENNSDGHGIRMLKKATLAVSASKLATGTKDNQFTNPVGLFYVATTKKLYVAEATRICVITVDDTDGAESLTWDTSYAISGIRDLFFDGTNWFTIGATKLTKWDNVFTDATKVEVSVVGYYSITDCQNGNLALVNIVNSSLALYAKSNLTQVGSYVGSSGDGSASLFDPVITGVAGTWYMDDGSTFAVASGANISWNGFRGYTWKSAGPHRAVFRPGTGGLAAVTAIDCNGDLITSIKNLNKCRSLSTFYPYNNPEFSFSLRDIVGPINNLTIFDIAGSYDLADLPAMSSAAVRFQSTIPPVTGALSSLRGTYTTFQCPLRTITGSLSDIYSGAQTVWLYGCTGITPASIAHLTAIRDIRIYSMGWTAQQNTDVLASAYNARMGYTYASGIQLRISAPTGTPGTEPPADGESNADWNWNAGTGKHEPLTGYAYMFMLGNDIYSEGYKTWSVTIV